MIFLGIILLVIGLKEFNSILLNRLTIIIYIYSTILVLSIFNMIELNNINLYGGLWQTSTFISFIEIFIYITAGILLLIVELYKNKIKLHFSLLTLFSIFGMISLISSNDLISFFLSLELQSFPLYILICILKENESIISSSLKYFFIGALSSSILLLGISIIYGYTGLTNYDDLILLNDLNNIGILFISIGLLIKLGIVPFHYWIGDVYDGVPIIITSWISILPKISIIIGLLIIYKIFNNIQFLFLICSLLSLIIGSILGFIQYKIKKLLVYSSITHMGYILLNLGIMNNTESLIFYLIIYIITNINIFIILNTLALEKDYNSFYDINFLYQLKGQFINNPLLSICLSMNILSLAGIPPFAGFFSKLYILLDSFDNGYYFISIIAIITSILSASYYLRLIKIIHFDIEDNLIIKLKESLSNIISILTLLLLLYIFYPTVILNFIFFIV